jgi:hypothetical protein
LFTILVVMSRLIETDDADQLCRIRHFQTLGSVLSLEKLGQTFFAVIMIKTPLLMGFLVYELNCQR